MTTRILAATDLRAGSDEALREAHAWAGRTGAELAICHTLPDLMGVNAMFPARTPLVAAQIEAIVTRVRERVLERAAAVMPRATVQAFVEQGAAYSGIVRRADAWKVDLVVVGSYHRDGLARPHLGSVADQVVRHARCSVLVARSTEKRGAVLAATDFSDAALPAIAAAAEEAGRRGARLVVMHAIDFSSVAITLEELFLSAVLPTAAWDIDQELRALVEGKLRDGLTQLGVTGETHVAHGSAAATIVRIADDVGAELVVVGARGRTGLARLALGSVAEEVVGSALCPVLAVRLAT